MGRPVSNDLGRVPIDFGNNKAKLAKIAAEAGVSISSLVSGMVAFVLADEDSENEAQEFSGCDKLNSIQNSASENSTHPDSV